MCGADRGVNDLLGKSVQLRDIGKQHMDVQGHRPIFEFIGL